MIDFVGAGPGAADLITVRGKKLLEEADVIVYAGSLVNPELLQFAKADAEIFNSAHMTLEQVTEIMLKADSCGKRVVRLHTGEPSIYGAVREQMDLLEEHGVDYCSCPGVSACFGAAASMNLEYTLPGVSQSLIITRMEGRTPVPEREKIEDLASHHTSMAIYLSAGMLEALQEKLLAGGYSPNTPAAIVYKATWPEEKIYRCSVGSLAETGKKNGILKTAIVLVGDAVDPAEFARSKLYDPEFSHGCRRGSRENRTPEETCFAHGCKL